MIQRFRNLPPPLLLASGLVGMILAGTFLLRLPMARPGDPLSWPDALFTATSAACVTGLLVVDTGGFSLFGQVVILVLIQLGGLGVMTVGTIVIFALGQRPAALLREVLTGFASHRPTLKARDVLGMVVATTFVCEAVGALLLYPAFLRHEVPAHAAWSALFHSVSAFCNAGFSLYPDSMARYATSPLVNLTMMTLIVVGGIGFVVLVELRLWLRARRAGTERRALSLHTRILLAGTAVAIAAGFFLILLFEAQASLAHRPWGERLWIALFQSVTSRTAGFNTVEIASLTSPTLLILIALMFIGAGPGSTSGGIKVTTATAILAFLFHSTKGHREVRVFRRAIGEATLQRAIVVTTMGALLVGGTVILLEIDRAHGAVAHEGLLQVLFETVSALGTVGLSMGFTREMDTFQKMLLLPLMFLGRIGPLTIVDYYRHRPPEPAVRHATEELMVG